MTRRLPRASLHYNEMSENGPAEFKPIGTTGPTILGYYETFFRDIIKLFLSKTENFPPARCAQFLSLPAVLAKVLFSLDITEIFFWDINFQ